MNEAGIELIRIMSCSFFDWEDDMETLGRLFGSFMRFWQSDQKATVRKKVTRARERAEIV